MRKLYTPQYFLFAKTSLHLLVILRFENLFSLQKTIIHDEKKKNTGAYY